MEKSRSFFFVLAGTPFSYVSVTQFMGCPPNTHSHTQIHIHTHTHKYIYIHTHTFLPRVTCQINPLTHTQRTSALSIPHTKFPKKHIKHSPKFPQNKAKIHLLTTHAARHPSANLTKNDNKK